MPQVKRQTKSCDLACRGLAMIYKMDAFGWLAQASYDWGQLAVAARQYDSRASGEFRLLSEINGFIADKVRMATLYFNDLVTLTPNMRMKSEASSTDTIKFNADGTIGGTLYDSAMEILAYPPAKMSDMATFTAGASGDEIDQIKMYLGQLITNCETTFPALSASALNLCGMKQALFEKLTWDAAHQIEFHSYEIPTEFYGRRALCFCSICGASYSQAFEKCDTCEAGWSAAEFWPK